MRKSNILFMLCFIVIIIGFIYCFAARPENILKGRYYEAENGAHLIITDKKEPIELVGDDRMFEGIESGDEIEVFCSAVRETYPGSTDVEKLRALSEGDISDLPEEVMEQLNEMGW